MNIPNSVIAAAKKDKTAIAGCRWCANRWTPLLRQ